MDIDHVNEVAASINAAGFSEPVLIDEADNLLNGVVRVEAAKRLGISSIPCIVAKHLTATERRVLRLALNRLQEKGSWDFDTLKLEFEGLILEDVSLEAAGFSSAEIDQVLLDDEAAVVEQGPLAPEPGREPIAKLGEIYSLGKHKIICGDARDPSVLTALMGEARARLILTDEPYNVEVVGHVTRGPHREFLMGSGEMSDPEFRCFNDDWMRSSLPYLVEGGILSTFIDWRGFPTVHAAAIGMGLSPINLVVWAKANGGMGSLYRSQHELLPLFKKGTAPHTNNVVLGKQGRWRSNLWTFPGASSLGSDARGGLQHHPTVKTVALLEEALLDISDRGDIVLDPFIGSGSTLIAAEKTGRRCYGVELDPLYVDLILGRYETITGNHAVRHASG